MQRMRNHFTVSNLLFWFIGVFLTELISNYYHKEKVIEQNLELFSSRLWKFLILLTCMRI